MSSNLNSSNDNNQSVLLAQLLNTNSKLNIYLFWYLFFISIVLDSSMFSSSSSTAVSNNMNKFRNNSGSYQPYQQAQQIPYQLIQRRARTPDHVLTSYTDHFVYRKPSPVFMNQR